MVDIRFEKSAVNDHIWYIYGRTKTEQRRRMVGQIIQELGGARRYIVAVKLLGIQSETLDSLKDCQAFVLTVARLKS